MDIWRTNSERVWPLIVYHKDSGFNQDLHFATDSHTSPIPTPVHSFFLQTQQPSSTQSPIHEYPRQSLANLSFFLRPAAERHHNPTPARSIAHIFFYLAYPQLSRGFSSPGIPVSPGPDDPHIRSWAFLWTHHRCKQRSPALERALKNP